MRKSYQGKSTTGGTARLVSLDLYHAWLPLEPFAYLPLLFTKQDQKIKKKKHTHIPIFFFIVPVITPWGAEYQCVWNSVSASAGKQTTRGSLHVQEDHLGHVRVWTPRPAGKLLRGSNYRWKPWHSVLELHCMFLVLKPLLINGSYVFLTLYGSFHWRPHWNCEAALY